MEQITDTLDTKMTITPVIKENTDLPPDRSLIKPVMRAPLDLDPYNNRHSAPGNKLKYKEEKKLKKLKKGMEYRESYKAKEQARKSSNTRRDMHTDTRNNYQLDKFNMDKLDLCDDLILILKDKIKNNQIQLTGFEQKTVNKFFSQFEKKDNKEKHMSTNSVQLQNCFTGDKCIVWYCRFEHGNGRKKECKCTNVDCKNLHMHQALCKNPNHADDCAIAHNIEELAKNSN
jgi:hypothetical protein